MDNDGLGLQIIKGLRKPIEACGIDYDLLKKMASHDNPLYLAVHDKNLGMEKLDYLERDGLYTILARPAGIEYLRRHVYFINGELAIDEKVIDNAVEAQNFYMKMYKNVYLRKSSAIAQRMVQKMVYHLIAAGEITVDDLPKLTDSELVGFIYFSRDETVKTLYRFLRRRDLFREAIIFRPEAFAKSEEKNGKSVKVFGVTSGEIKGLTSSPSLKQKNLSGLEELEGKIAALSGIPKNSVLIVPVFNPDRFTAKDIKIYKSNGNPESLQKLLPAHFKNMEEIAHSYWTLRICTQEQYRNTLSSPKVAKEIFDLLIK
ncbi:MAG: hypothetical protein KGJ89_00430 [Patescibacteria group bacterium]|nr:hypothetical protein [Patescibacteria group bacterium]MDE2014987.1 hypothetical protein [Patescibacteria group bacterium]MDE2226416.1 hypothetical protein [Patescibacteria group bacterium]